MCCFYSLHMFSLFFPANLSFYLPISHTVSTLRANSRPYSTCTAECSLIFNAQKLQDRNYDRYSEWMNLGNAVKS